ncbi:hypothetical protein GALL_24920 [mine drainage metagenome]|uniref:Uncharacterized protein n=1 Tax=mine drainage metagenome TaxID=410659 RepID=A0A1J5T9G9_9ZZZZ
MVAEIGKFSRLVLFILSEYQLTERLIALSVGNTWDEAKLEWGLEHVWREDEPDTCLCGHFPIIEICLLRNVRNSNTAIVGNCCVKKFTNLPSDLIFQAVKRIESDVERALNAETIHHAHEKGWINDWERKFYMNTWRKRKLSGAQHAKRVQINQKVLDNIVRARNRAKS